MEHRKQHLPLIALAVGLLALGSGCMTADATKTGAKKPDVTQAGVLPPPQETMKPASAMAPAGGVVPAGGIQTGANQGTFPANLNPSAASPSTLAKLTSKMERKVQATEMAVAWRNRIAYLPDPTRNGAMGAGIAGQLFLYGGPNLQFALADGTLTVDMVDETPRPAGQAAATPERWQIDKNTLRNLRTVDETFGKSYVLFLPWPAYKADITKVRISARYDPENGHTLYATPSVVSIDTSAPLGSQVFDSMSNTIKPMGPMTPGGFGPSQPFGGMQPGGGMPPGMFTTTGVMPMGGPAPSPLPLNPIPLGGPPNNAVPMGSVPPMGSGSTAGGSMPMMPLPPGAGMPPAGAMPAGAMPPAGGMPAEPLPPIGITIGPR